MKAGKVAAVKPPEDRTKISVSVERLVVWAYREQMVHAARPEGMPVEIARDWSPKIAQTDFGKEMVSSSVKLNFTCAPDAYRVHDSVMRLPEVQRTRSVEEVECMLARKLCSNEISRLYSDGSIRETMDLGQESRGDGTRLPPTHVVHLPSLVFEWAMKGCAPDWVAAPVYAFERGRALYRGQRKEGIGHIVTPVGDDPLKVAEQRSLYTLWARALRLLHADIARRHRMGNHRLNDVLPDEAPWEIQGSLDMGKKLA